MKTINNVVVTALLAILIASTASAQRLVAVKSYYPSHSKSSMGNTEYITNQYFACYAEFYNDYSYVMLQGNQYNYKETRNSDHYYYPVNKGYKELVFSNDFKQMAYLFLDFEIMGIRSTTHIFYNYLGEGKELAEAYKQRQTQSSNGGISNYGGGNNSYGGNNNYNNGNNTPKIIKCGLCLGDGKCLKCSGRGVHTNPYTGKYITCSYCNATGKCSHCNGSGQCTCNRNTHPNSCNMVYYRNQYM